jgi:hypothetical protein
MRQRRDRVAALPPAYAPRCRAISRAADSTSTAAAPRLHAFQEAFDAGHRGRSRSPRPLVEVSPTGADEIGPTSAG